MSEMEPPESAPEIEITPEMIEAGEEAILEEVGGAELGGHFSARGLASKVYLAMKMRELGPTDLNISARFLLALHGSPELLDDFKRLGKVPRCFSSLDAHSLRDIRRAL